MTDAEGLTTTYTYDALGRTIAETCPGFCGALLVTSNEYNTANQLVATRTYVLNENSTPTPLTYTYFCYNSLGERTLTVSDMNLNNQIDWSDTDRIVSNDTRYVLLDGDWWRESSSWQTRQNGSPALTRVGLTRTRLTGHDGRARPPASPQGFLLSETHSYAPLNAVVRQSFVWDPTEPVATRPLTWQRGNSAAYYVVDGNKNVSEVVDSDGSLAAHYEYAPFGAVILQRGESAATNPWRFSSEYAEDDTATIYYNYRHYEPVMGRWLSRDPVGEEDGLNIYVFIDNGLDVDSLGLVKFDSTCDSIKSNCEGEFKDIIDELGKIAAKYIPEKFPDNDIPGESPREKKRRRKEWIAEHKDDPLWKAILDVYDKYGLIEHKKNGDKIFRTIWRTSEAMRKGFGQVKDDFEKGSTIITCCPDKMSGLCDSDDPRFKTSGGYLPYSDAGIFASAYRGKIVVCPSLMGKGGFDKHGGCGCFIMHELMHKYGMRIPRKDKPHELAIENAMIEIQRIILGAFSKHVCKGYDVN